jgi:HlyD family secretion protein
MEVRVNVNENDVVNVEVGDTARVQIDAYPNRIFRGQVREIANAARTTGTGTQEEVTNFEVRIRLVDPGVPLRPGMSASADIETETVTGALTVPIQSVTVRTRTDGRTREDVERQREEEASRNRGEGAAVAVNQAQVRQQERSDRDNLQRVVFVKKGDTVEQRAVTTGIADFSHIVITDGVEAGEEVVSGSFAAITRQLKDGTRVTLEQPRTPGSRRP